MKQLASQYIKFTDDNSLSKRILENKSITIPEKPVKIGFIKLMKPRISVKFHKLWIEITQYDPNIEINNIAKLIELECGSESKSHFNDFMINSNKYDYKIIFDPSQISDYLDINRNNGMISFVLKYQFRPDTQEKIIEEYEMKIAFDKSESQLNGDFDLSPKSKSESESASELESESDFRTGFEHRRERKIPFGSFKLINKSNYKYTNLVDCILKINFIGLADNLYNFPDDNTIQWGDINEIKETLDSFDMQGDFKEEDEDKVFSFNIKKVSKNIYDLQNILPNNEITIPAYIDLENIENPIGSAKYLAKVFMEYKFANKNDTKEKFDNFDISFIIKQDTRTTKLDTFYLDNGNHYECNSDQETKISSNLQWIKDMKGEYECFTFKLGNCAVSGDGAVYIHNFLVQFRYLDNSKNIIQTNNNESIFIIRNKNSKEINSGIDFVFQNDKESFEKITIAFRHDRIKDIPRDIVPLACNISFYYLEQDICFDNDLDLAAAITSNGIPYSHDFIFSIERNLGPYWLAVDFGTSAIVAAFDKNNDGDLSLLNLQKSLKERLIKVKQQKEYHNDNIMEFETPFLSSTIALRHQGIIHTNNINDNIILLSPTKNELLDTYLIPYMKALIGSEFLPPLDKAINEIEYYEDNNKKQLKRFKDHPIKVTNILVNTYKSLFRDYISSFIKDIKENDKNTEMNKIILTIPNTFTPRHMDYLRNLIKSEFGEFKEDYIKFISESDAAACYYVNNRSTLCSSRNLNEKKKLFDNEEYVLIYDIGAGTLDLTYLNIKQVKDIQKVTIIGRIGNHIAGNFLDYSIAKAINDIIKNDDPFTVRLFGKGDLRDMIARRKLKEIIRDSIKIKLDTNDKIKILKTDFEDGVLKQDIDIDIQQIRNNKYIKIFLNKNSKDIFKTFFNLYNEFGGQKRNKGNYPIDTVFLTGRTALFKTLRDSIKSELKQWSNNDNIYYIEINNQKKLKSIVADGALQFALLYRNQENSGVIFQNNNLQARYGFLYKNPKYPDKWKYKELLNPSTKPVKSKPIIKDGIMIFEYDTDKYDTDPDNDEETNTINLSRTSTGYFVQSFSSNTEEDMNKGNNDYITRMFDFDRSLVMPSGKEAEVSVKINSDNEMIVKVGKMTNDATQTLKIDLSDNNNVFMESMWPYVEKYDQDE